MDLILPDFNFVEPPTIEEVCAALAGGTPAKALAGGTDLLVNMKLGFEAPSLLVNLKKVTGLDSVRITGNGLTVGALTTLRKLYSTPEVKEKLPALAQAASLVGSYHHQVMGTIGGNVCQQNRCRFLNQSAWWRSARPPCFKTGGQVCHAVKNQDLCYAAYYGDVAPVLIVLGARAEVAGVDGTGSRSVESLFTGDGKSPLDTAPGEIITNFVIPAEAMDGVSVYLKHADRGGIDFPIVGLALWASKKTKEYRICYTAVDRKPVRARQAEALLAGRDLTRKLVEEAAGLADREARPVKNSPYPPSYKKRLMRHMLARAIEQALEV